VTRALLSRCIAAALLAGCASAFRTADRAFESGDYARAAAGYRSVLGRSRSGEGADRALFRLALVHALPSSPLCDAARAEELLGEVIARFPSGLYGAEARLVLPLVQRIGELQETLEEESACATALQSTVDASAARLHESDAALQAKDEELARARASLTESRERLHRVESELEALKRIDLRRRP